MSPTREKGISRQGYLTKAPFHGESNGTPGAKVHLFLVLLWFVFCAIFLRRVGGRGVRGALPSNGLKACAAGWRVAFLQLD